MFISINGTVITTPATCKWGLQDISSPESGRTLDGVMHNNVVAQKRKLSIHWPACTGNVAQKIITYCKKKGSQLSVTYPDLADGKMETRQFYTGDCTASYAIWINDYTRVGYVECDFIEI